MHESDTYLAIIDEGQEKFAKRAILAIGAKLFGPAEESVKAQLACISDLERLERMLCHAVEAADWQEILATK